MKFEDIKEPEDFFLTKEFKELPWTKRVMIRIKIAFYMAINML